MLNIAEKVFPGFYGHIEEVEAATPLTHMRYLGHPAGAIYGFDQYAKDSPLFEDRRSAVPGLFFAGPGSETGLPAYPDVRGFGGQSRPEISGKK